MILDKFHRIEVALRRNVVRGNSNRSTPSKLEKTWYENGKLMARGVLFEPTDDKGRVVFNAIKSGNLKGLSLGFSFNSSNHKET